MRTKTLALFLLLGLPFAAAIAQKQRDWKTGTVRDASRSRYFAGSFVDANFVIEGDTSTYFAQEHLKFRWSKPADLPVNAKTKYALSRNSLYVIDAKGKEHEMEILGEVPRDSSGTTAP